jgi:ABC-type branched-subunit amino acid transport system ATPase component
LDARERPARELDTGTARRLELARAAPWRRRSAPDEPTTGMNEAESAAMIDHPRPPMGDGGVSS